MPLSNNPLVEIAVLMAALTYGEMIELGAGMWKAAGDQPVTEAALPGILHRWAEGRKDGGQSQ